MEIIEGVTEMQKRSLALRAGGFKVVFVPTMGFLHDGHRELLRVGRERLGDKGALVLSIFVNPAQFGPKEDYGSYPRDLGRDLKIAEEAGVDVVFTPKAGEVYPSGYKTYVEVMGLGDNLCGPLRPGHFKGVATVVLKLFNIVGPHAAIFGAKDYQQLQIIKKMALDLNLGIDIVGVETVREPDGLAMSSRNAYLSPGERKQALCVPSALESARLAFAGGIRESSVLIEKMKKNIEKEPGAVVEYIKVCDKESLVDLERITKDALVAIAVRIGKARLIDNCILS